MDYLQLTSHWAFGLQLLLTGHVHAILTDRGEDFAGDPVLELVGLRFVGSHDELVEPGLGDDVGKATGQA